MIAPYHGRLLGGLSCEARIDVVHGTSVPATVDDLYFGGAHEFAVDRLDVLGRQLVDAIGELQDRCKCLVLGLISISQKEFGEKTMPDMGRCVSVDGRL